ncbi:beta-N-acetylhexosaminidase [Silvibacterium dinghuense]|uniref:beta-N-acetylhexosaminidase n=1 Tax=Silvibacterium dinghuense TaxID=1560006 RepID=A0A4Q1SDY5_9BACT|nr:beta-N-acetylhexosaminidase [Silvibacterium dinghuense]RXS95317.1 beta-N-acetylhexosaminidase [Silvibacterium dinghuense]GGH12354.1 beta-hexosaminidase [Silvibacterium dinghuense]
MTSLRQRVGQLLFVGLEGPSLSAVERAWLRLVAPSGVILFRRNIENVDQVRSLLREAQSLTPHSQFHSVDLEGGLVDRLRDLIAPMPSPAAVFASGKSRLFRRHGELIGAAAHLTGFNQTLAPVLDLALPSSAEVMRTRVVSDTPQEVVAYASAFLDGLARANVLGCGKHFPGLGGGTLDSHHAMPAIERSWPELWDNDLAVFRALAPRLPMVMVAHASYPLNESTEPASVSSFWIDRVLRRKIGFRGIVISDDMEMGGILTQRSIEDAAIEAIAAGTDVIEICKDPALILRAYESLLREAERSAAFRRRIENATRRIAALRRKLPAASLNRNISTARISRIRTAIHKFAEEIAR